MTIDGHVDPADGTARLKEIIRWLEKESTSTIPINCNQLAVLDVYECPRNAATPLKPDRIQRPRSISPNSSVFATTATILSTS